MNKVLHRILSKTTLPEKKETFSCLLAICTHRDVKVKVLNQIRALEKCPDPKIVTYVMEGDAAIDRARSRVATKFLQDTDYDMLFFLDDDVVIDTLDATRIMWECYKKKLDVVGAAYPLKKMSTPGFAIRTHGEGQVQFGKSGSIVDVRSISGGCMCIRRETLQKIVDNQKLPLCDGATGQPPLYPFFEPMHRYFDDKWHYLTEDWAFTQRVLDSGMKIWCDTTTKLGHIGPYTYTWDDFFRPPLTVHEDPIYNISLTK